MKKIFLVLFSLFLSINCVSAKEWKKVRIATESAFPPFSFVNKDGQISGFNVDIAHAFCKEMKVECEIIVHDFDTIIPGLLANKYDAIISSMSITEERKKQVAFTDKYYQSGGRFVVSKDKAVDILVNGLQGKSIGVQRATTHANFLKDNYNKKVKVIEYDTTDNAHIDLFAGRVDALLDDTLAVASGLFNKEEGKQYQFIGPELTNPKWFGEGIGIAVRKDNAELVEMFNKAIKESRKNGSYQKVNANYFPFDIYGE